MKNKEISIKDITKAGWVEVKKVITMSLQLYDSDLQNIIDFNKQNDYQYTFEYKDHNLIDSENIIKLIRNGYNMFVDSENDILIFKHRNLIEREKNDE